MKATRIARVDSGRGLAYEIIALDFRFSNLVHYLRSKITMINIKHNVKLVSMPI